jgi:hypothetical protein
VFSARTPGKGQDIKNSAAAAWVILLLVAGAVCALESLEKQKIEFLILSIENLKGAKFIRNGAEYDGKKAAEHLRMKLQMAGGKVRTAEDFIMVCASKSSMSGKPYRIKFSDGKVMASEAFFREKLKEFVSTPTNKK